MKKLLLFSALSLIFLNNTLHAMDSDSRSNEKPRSSLLRLSPAEEQLFDQAVVAAGYKDREAAEQVLKWVVKTIAPHQTQDDRYLAIYHEPFSMNLC